MGKGFLDYLCSGQITLSPAEFEWDRQIAKAKYRQSKIKEWFGVRTKLTEVSTLNNWLFEVAMNEGGFYVQRGTWHESKMTKKPMPHKYELREVIKPDEVGLLLKDDPDGIIKLMPRWGGDMATQLQDLLIARLTKDKSKVAAIKAELAKLQTDLRGPSPTLIECLIVERIISAWLCVVWAEYLFEVCATDLEDLKLGIYADKIKTSANHHYMLALTRLDLVRRINPIRGTGPARWSKKNQDIIIE